MNANLCSRHDLVALVHSVSHSSWDVHEQNHLCSGIIIISHLLVLALRTYIPVCSYLASRMPTNQQLCTCP